MLRLTLSDAERAAVQALRRDRTLSPAERDRVEMILLSEAGWSLPRIAAHLGCQDVGDAQAQQLLGLVAEQAGGAAIHREDAAL